MWVELVGLAGDRGDEIARRLAAQVHPITGRARRKRRCNGDDSDQRRQSFHHHHPEVVRTRLYPLAAVAETLDQSKR